MRPHPIVHRRHQQHGRFGGEEDGREQIARLAGGGAGHEVRGGGRDDHRVRLAGEPDVVQGMAGREQVRVDLASREALERERPNEFLRAGGEHDIDFGAGL